MVIYLIDLRVKLKKIRVNYVFKNDYTICEVVENTNKDYLILMKMRIHIEKKVRKKGWVGKGKVNYKERIGERLY